MQGLTEDTFQVRGIRELQINLVDIVLFDRNYSTKLTTKAEQNSRKNHRV